MSWVRYDDAFYSHPKVTAVIAEDPGAIALHALANTWSNTTKRPGYVPAHQPGVLLADKRRGSRWAALLVKHGLWHRRGDECDTCIEQCREWPEHEDGYVIHDWHRYRAPDRDRTTPGTPSDLSEKRRQAGRKGGKRSAAKREQDKQEAQASQANGVSKTSNAASNGVSPVLSTTSNEAVLRPEPVPPTADAVASGDTSQTILAEYIDWCRKRPPRQVIGQLGKLVAGMLEEGISADDIKRGMADWHSRKVHPSVLPSIVNDVMNGGQGGPRNASPQRESTTDRRVTDAVALAQRLAEEDRAS